ncbi:hypothetical protein [Nonomuraea sp. B1E8]|uniref:hypothetical protein n=1 Tax=unclassified Nonomuraea TaxID=2593643 RepID=UPI00325F05C0
MHGQRLVTAPVGLALGLGLPAALGPGVDVSAFAGGLPVSGHTPSARFTSARIRSVRVRSVRVRPVRVRSARGAAGPSPARCAP